RDSPCFARRGPVGRRARAHAKTQRWRIGHSCLVETPPGDYTNYRARLDTLAHRGSLAPGAKSVADSAGNHRAHRGRLRNHRSMLADGAARLGPASSELQSPPVGPIKFLSLLSF